MSSITILGAGVVGLTTALKIQDAYPDAEVTVVAELFPGDTNIKSTKYTSIWAVRFLLLLDLQCFIMLKPLRRREHIMFLWLRMRDRMVSGYL